MLLRPPQQIDATKVFLLNEKHTSFITTGKGKLYEVPQAALILVWAIPIAGIVLSLYLLTSALNRRATLEELTQSGVTTQAQVVTHRTSEGKSTTYYLTYQFTGIKSDQTSQLYTQEKSVVQSLYDSTKDGDSIAIRYLPRDPHVSYPAPLPAPSLLEFLTPVFLLVTSPLSFYILTRMALKQRKLQNEGQVLPGELVECTGRKVKNKYQVTAKYRFVSPLGEEKLGHKTYERNDLQGVALPPTGTPVAILYADEKVFEVL